jgi:G patch domain-containing protein 1
MPGQPRDEFNKELEDYAKAASLFKPISGAMAGRFTSAAVIDFGPEVHEGLHTPTNEEIAAKEAQERKEAEDKISPKAHAAKMGMYGLLTREKKLWQPARLLCKRFGVKDPNPEPEIISGAAASSSTATTSFTHSESQEASISSPVADTTPMQTRDGPRDLANIGLGEDETQGQDTLTYERPSMDIFKAIFASDDEDSDQEEKEPEEGNELDPTNDRDSGTGFTPATVIFDDSPVDTNTFKPTFIPREGKSNKAKKEDKSKDKKDKKKKEKKSVLVSFEMEEDGAEGAELRQPKDRPKKKRKDKTAKAEDDNEQAVWAAPKSPPGLPPPPLHAQTTVPSDERGPKGRKRAIDFM